MRQEEGTLRVPSSCNIELLLVDVYLALPGVAIAIVVVYLVEQFATLEFCFFEFLVKSAVLGYLCFDFFLKILDSGCYSLVAGYNLGIDETEIAGVKHDGVKHENVFILQGGGETAHAVGINAEFSVEVDRTVTLGIY